MNRDVWSDYSSETVPKELTGVHFHLCSSDIFLRSDTCWHEELKTGSGVDVHLQLTNLPYWDHEDRSDKVRRPKEISWDLSAKMKPLQ